MLVAIYALFALSASARAAVQIATKFSHAPVAYLLSAFAAVVYILATVTLAVGSPTARRIAVVSCSVELVGVLAVGTWSLADRATFPDATVWSGYGSGYGFVPLVLPVFGLLWLRHWSKRARTRRDGRDVSGRYRRGGGWRRRPRWGRRTCSGRRRRRCAVGPRCRVRSIVRNQVALPQGRTGLE